jgi:hypothetical protein
MKTQKVILQRACGKIQKSNLMVDIDPGAALLDLPPGQTRGLEKGRQLDPGPLGARKGQAADAAGRRRDRAEAASPESTPVSHFRPMP